ncbi:MAG TPA: sigma-70 family RNA polymerase sigma factor [Actinomycetota bacterium]|nr:sigma-70 family RNA polymerase sigma factor [Actinomycetota bacterium]
MNELTRRRFEATALEFLGPVYDYAYRLTSDSSEAQDLTQETFLRAFRSFDSFQPGTNCRAWLFRIAYNLSCNDYRRRLRMPRVDQVDKHADLFADLASDAPGPEEQVLRLLDGEALHRALAELPDRFRDAVILVEIHGLSCAEAGEVMGTPRGTVLSRLHRARGRLRQLLAVQAQDRAVEAGECAKAS